MVRAIITMMDIKTGETVRRESMRGWSDLDSAKADPRYTRAAKACARYNRPGGKFAREGAKGTLTLEEVTP